jgi:hypothetical protein
LADRRHEAIIFASACLAKAGHRKKFAFGQQR